MIVSLIVSGMEGLDEQLRSCNNDESKCLEELQIKSRWQLYTYLLRYIKKNFFKSASYICYLTWNEDVLVK